MRWVILLNTIRKVHLLRGVFWALLSHFQMGLRLVACLYLETESPQCVCWAYHLCGTDLLFTVHPGSSVLLRVCVTWYLAAPTATSVPCGERTVLLPQQEWVPCTVYTEKPIGHRGPSPRDWSWSHPVSSVCKQGLIPSARGCVALLGDSNTKTPWAERPQSPLLMTGNRCHLFDKHTWENPL